MDRNRQIIKRIIYKYLKGGYNGPVDLISIDIMTGIYKNSFNHRNIFDDDELFQISLHKKIGIADLQEDGKPGAYREFLNTLLVSSVLDTRTPISLDRFAEISAEKFQIIEK